MGVREDLSEEEAFHLQPRREEREMGHVFQVEQHVKALRQGRAQQAQRPEADQQGWSTERWLAELARVSSNLTGKAGPLQ